MHFLVWLCRSLSYILFWGNQTYAENALLTRLPAFVLFYSTMLHFNHSFHLFIVCTHAHTYVNTRTLTHSHSHAHIHTHMHIHVRTHERTHVHTCTHKHAHTYTYVQTHTHNHALTHAQKCTHTNMHAHTHRHTSVHKSALRPQHVPSTIYILSAPMFPHKTSKSRMPGLVWNTRSGN